MHVAPKQATSEVDHRRLLADVAVSDDALARRCSCRIENALELLRRLECAVIVEQCFERHVPGTRHVAFPIVHTFRLASVEALIARVDNRRAWISDCRTNGFRV